MIRKGRSTVIMENERNAAKDLNISERTLYRKIKEYGLELKQLKSS